MEIKTNAEAKPPVQENHPENVTKKRVWTGSFAVLALACLAAYWLLQLQILDVFGTYRPILIKAALAGFFVMLILTISKILETIIARRAKTRVSGYNLVRVIRLVSILFVAAVIISFLFANWYAAAVSLGLISLVLGFALQAPLTSFFGWINILLRAPYHVGDRIQINEFKGDVVEISYLDTTLWEFGGDYLTNDVPSGRLIRFPNSLVLEAAVYNYSWRKFPYIWNEIPFHVAYESDLDYVSNVIKRVAKQELGEEMEEKINTFKAILEQTPVDELDIKEYPYVSYRISVNTWVEVILTYLVEPKQASGIRTRLVKNIINELLKEPDKVMFPKSNAR